MSAPSKVWIITLAAILFFTGCDDDNDKKQIDYTNIDVIDYGDHVQPLLDQSCAVSGCHVGTDPSAGLSLANWNDAVRGSENGEVLIPFSSDQSLMINLFDSVAKRAEHPALSENRALDAVELAFLKRWIDEGARNDGGTVPFSGGSDRVYVTNQLSDKISVIDVANNVVARVVTVGSSPSAEEAHYVVANDDFYYVTLISAGEVWKLDARTDTVITTATVGGSPALLALTPDGEKLYVSQFMNPANPTDMLQIMETATMTVTKTIEIAPSPLTQIPHGIRMSNDGTRIYLASLGADYVTVIDTENDSVLVQLNLNPGGTAPCRPLQVTLSPDDSELWVSCLDEDAIRIYDTETFLLLATIPTGADPWHTQFTPDGTLCFVPNRVGNSVMVIDAGTRSVVKTITDPAITLPHGCGVSSDGNYVYISNGNPNGDFIPRYNLTNVGNVIVIDVALLEIVKVLEVEQLPTGLFVYP